MRYTLVWQPWGWVVWDTINGGAYTRPKQRFFWHSHNVELASRVCDEANRRAQKGLV